MGREASFLVMEREAISKWGSMRLRF
ncbi:hypothetical protein [Pyrobaculum aerophilum]|uniref:Uncharacterized protein n=2 Tax=Pyrobaculum aerophilum TaxID=13773 RepID=Q8ZYV5_PYRAE|nr:hypothetical protein PAE0602a [Pyrobaculum aerophilum str. IM2]HII46023.1 hypothetical protein [Pyrobaculum aerophilum]